MIKRRTLITLFVVVALAKWLLFGEYAVDFVVVALNVPKRINPLEKVLKMTKKEPNVGVSNSTHHFKDYVQEMWLPQKLDHFADSSEGGNNSSSDNQTWMMVSRWGY